MVRRFRYDEVLVPKELHSLGHSLHEQLEQAVEVVLDIMDQTRLLEGDRVIRRAVEARHPYIDPLNLLQSTHSNKEPPCDCQNSLLVK
jgi:phosphoenolpyruvate carboxylase